MTASYEDLLVETRAQWRAWLDRHHDDTPGIWLVRWKAGSGHPTLPYDDVVEEAICWGWVDSRPRTVDAERSALLVTPRRAGSSWSAVNKGRVAALLRDGRIAPPGLAIIDAAKADGSWSALDEVETLTEPDDLRQALDSHADARREWDAFPRSTRRAILEWISTAKSAPTRDRRIATTVSDAANGVRANQWRQPKGSR